MTVRELINLLLAMPSENTIKIDNTHFDDENTKDIENIQIRVDYEEVILG